ncbi:hypothetical protein JOC70_002262 [Clostridium pascui]|uniref:hypothetical protein n=1 Tax=Clostridium pascui TaxID=46609 RepID=UPI001957FE69|nr:hypothetical protein [Clostridium pascui]MBM7870768.1 hypothetical protein [Clostridium pascui]
MYGEVWNNYKKGFKFLLPFILVKVLFESTSLNLEFDKYDFFGKGGNLLKNLSVSKQIIINEAIPILFYIFIGSLFYSFSMVVIKALVNKKDINYKENFKESLGFYLRYLGLNIIISAISIGLIVLGFWGILIPFMVILLILFNVLLIPCDAYLIYYNTSVGEALKKGTALGKKHFGELLLLGITVSIILAIIGGVMALANISPKINPIGSVLMNFASASIGGYLYMFTMTICKKEEKVEEKIIEC